MDEPARPTPDSNSTPNSSPDADANAGSNAHCNRGTHADAKADCFDIRVPGFAHDFFASAIPRANDNACHGTTGNAAGQVTS